MAEIQKNLRPSTGKTWEKEFEAVDKTTKAYQDLLDEFTKYVETQRDFSNEGIDQFTTLLKNLDDVKNHWDDINSSILTNSRSIEPFLGSAATVRDIFRDIVQESSTLGRQVNERYNLARKVRDVAGDMSRVYQTEEGLTKKILDQHIRKSEAVRYAWESQIRGIAGLQEDQEITSDLLQKYRAREESNIRILEMQKQRLEGAGRLSVTEAKRLRDIRTELTLRAQNIELLTVENKNAVEGLEQIARKRRELYEKYGNQRGEVNITVKALSKVDPTAGEKLQRDYNKFLSNKVEGWEKYNKAEDIKEAAQRRVDELGPINERELRRNLVTGQYRNVGQIRTAREEQQNKIQELLAAIQSNEQERKKTSSQLRRNELKKEYIQLAGNLRAAERDIVKLTDSLGENALERLEAQEGLEKANENFKKVSSDTLEVRTKEFGLVKSIGSVLKSSLNPTKLLGSLAGAFVTAILAGFAKVDELGVQLRHRTGTWEHSMAAVNSQFATATDWLEMAVGLADKWHVSPQVIFTSTEIGKMAEAKNLMGLTADEAQNLGVYAKITGTSADAYRKSIAAGFQEYSKNNRSAVSLGATQKEVLSTSDSIRLSLGGSGKNIAEAANAALSLGTNLQGVEHISKHLMNFESSIKAEMQAQLLTGKQLNLAKAREYALNNDLAGVANEIKRQGIDSAWWGRSNYIQQENMAKALGMSREEMAKMLIQQELANGASTEMLAKNMKISEEELKAATMADTWKKSIAELAQALTPIIQAVRPFVEIVGVIVSKISSLTGWIFSLGGLLDRINEKTSKWIQTVGKLVLAWPLIGRVTGAFFTGLTGHVRKAVASFGSLKTAAIGAFAFVKNPKAGVQNIVSKVKNIGKGKIQKVGETGKAVSGTAATKAAGTTAQTVKGKGSNLPRLGSSIAQFLRKFDKVLPDSISKALKSALALIPIAVASPAIALASLTGKVAKGLIPLGQGIVGFFRAFSKVTVGSIGKGILAGLALVPIAAASPAIALASLAGPFAKRGLPALGQGIAGFFRALSKSGSAITQGSLYLVIFGAALIPLAFALRLAAPAFNAFANVVAAAGIVIKSVFAGLGTLLENITLEKAAALAVLGGGFAALGVGIAAGAVGLLLFPVKKFTKLTQSLSEISQTSGLSQVVSDLTQMSVALGSVAESLDKVDLQKFKKITTISTLGNLGNAIASRIAKPRENSSIPEASENTGESQGIRRETIEAAAQSIVIKQAQVQASAQQISIEQKATDLSKIEQKIDRVVKAVVESRPDWNWLEFNRAYSTNAL